MAVRADTHRRSRSNACRRWTATCAFALALLLAPSATHASYDPYVAVVMCEDTYAADWLQAQMSSQAFVGIAGLVGVPYATITVQELLDGDPSAYTSIWISRCGWVAPERYDALLAALSAYLAQGGSLLMDGPLGTSYQDAMGENVWRGAAALGPALNVALDNWHELSTYRVRMTSGAHPVHTRVGLAQGTTLTQGAAAGTEVIEIADPAAPGSAVLLELVSPNQTVTFPYLSTTTSSGGKVIVISGYGTWMGAASVFRNFGAAPLGFDDNLLLPYMVEAIQWLIAPDEPVVGLQLSHAGMTAIGRVDDDESERPGLQDRTLDFLLELAETTGVDAALAIVTSRANSGGNWSLFGGPKGAQLEKLGGLMGSHSHIHDYDMSVNLTDAQFAAEVGPSLDIVEAELAPIRAITPPRVFINPGSTIRNEDYSLVFAESDLYFTHGYEQALNYASGVMGFALDPGVAPKPVVVNAPVPDFQWLYLVDPSWVWSPAEVASLQTQILGWFQNSLGRGALYNEMWHDYGIGGDPPAQFPGETAQPLYDAHLAFFADNEVYAPSVAELIHKLHAARNTYFSSSIDVPTGDLIVTLDLSALSTEQRAALSGMGLRTSSGTTPIESVTIDGAAHFAFTGNTVVLPPASAASMSVRLQLGGGATGPEPRLEFISKPYAEFTTGSDGAIVELARPEETTKLCVRAAAEFIVLGAASQTRDAPDRLCAQTAHSSHQRKPRVVRLDNAHGLLLLNADRTVELARVEDGNASLLLGGGSAAGNVEFEAQVAPLGVSLDGAPAATTPTADGFAVTLPAGAGPLLELVYDLADTAESVKPKQLLVYRGRPSAINGATSLAAAIAELAQYEIVILGDGLQDPAHPDHADTVQIAAALRDAGSTVFGTVPVGVSTGNLPLDEIRQRLDDWNDTNVRGVLLDQFGYEFLTTRDRQNAIVDHAHSQSLLVAVSAEDPADAFDDGIDPSFNPDGEPTRLRSFDFYLWEGHQFRQGAFEAGAAWRSKANALAWLQSSVGFKILSVTTTDVDDLGAFDPDAFFYAWHSAVLYGHEATGWGEFAYSATGASLDQAPLRTRPTLNLGDSFGGSVIASPPLYQRSTELGWVYVNTSTHAFGFTLQFQQQASRDCGVGVYDPAQLPSFLLLVLALVCTRRWSASSRT
ncbi:MAG: hypothetical protein KJO57_18230 [Deltaproteobacteria bacterium]|nr:hypothetical protein [Deltaproteobacteria bacterium]